MEINIGANSTYKKLAVLCFANIQQYCGMVIHPDSPDSYRDREATAQDCETVAATLKEYL
jgi:hypothetical protein